MLLKKSGKKKPLIKLQTDATQLEHSPVACLTTFLVLPNFHSCFKLNSIGNPENVVYFL